MCVCVLYTEFLLQCTVSFSVLLVFGVFSLQPWREEMLPFIVRETLSHEVVWSLPFA